MFNILTVSEINRLSKIALEENFDDLCVEGEISNITYHISGHIYFTIKDSKSSLKVVIFNYRSRNIPDNLKHGDSIQIIGRLTIYEGTGQYQMIATNLENMNTHGDLHRKFLEIKNRLHAKGYFDEARKKNIPVSFNIGVITSEKGSVFSDIVRTAKARFPNINIFLYSASVQGDLAEEELIKGVEFFKDKEYIDTIIIGRGGGSFEDLNAFNSEKLAESIFNCSKPIISAVGHETDYVISDLVADVRASTPTQAAVIATLDITKLKISLDTDFKKFYNNLNNISSKIKDNLNSRLSNLNTNIFNRLERSKELILLKKKNYVFTRYYESLHGYILSLDNSYDRLNLLLNSKLDKAKYSVLSKISNIKNLNPLNVLERGYSVTTKGDKIIYKGSELKKDDLIETKFPDKKVLSRVI
jgi:exodeoxyribonuclease VII large subunit